jgi:hypothetical protein
MGKVSGYAIGCSGRMKFDRVPKWYEFKYIP